MLMLGGGGGGGGERAGHHLHSSSVMQCKSVPLLKPNWQFSEDSTSLTIAESYLISHEKHDSKRNYHGIFYKILSCQYCKFC